jgi:hypothetical protein
MARPAQYTDDDIKAIIGRALESQTGDHGGATHADLLAIAEQVGIAPAAIERAANEVLESRLDAEADARIRSTRKRWLGLHGLLFALINALLFTVNALTTPGEWWVLFSVFVWGLVLALHAGLVFGVGISAKRRRRERARIGAEPSARARRQLRVDEVTQASDTSASVARDEEPPAEPASPPQQRRKS